MAHTPHAFQVILSHQNGLPKDKFVNTWHFSEVSGGPGPTDFDNVRDMLKDFYQTGTNPLRSYFSDRLALRMDFKAYNLEQPKPRYPVYTSSITSGILWGGANALPFEVAMCLSFEAVKTSGEPQARRRNRVYLGPLTTTALSATDGKPLTAFPGYVLDAAKRLKSAADAAVNWEWVTWSELNNAHYEIKHIWVDDAFDTQRRRGMAPTVRAEHTY